MLRCAPCQPIATNSDIDLQTVRHQLDLGVLDRMLLEVDASCTPKIPTDNKTSA